jgi:ABC-type glycerol-3-phosphate transport system permease component
MSFDVWQLPGFFQEIPTKFEVLDGFGGLDVFRKILSADHVRTPSVALTGFSTSMGIRWGAFIATATVGIIPIFILTVLPQRHLVRGLTFGTIK